MSRFQLLSRLRYREKDSRMPNWIELPVNPPNARKIQIHNLAAGTTYEFQVRSVSIMHPPPPPPTPFRSPNVIVVSFSDLLAFKIHFQIIGINEYGDGMMSQIVEARTKGKRSIIRCNVLLLPSEIFFWAFISPPLLGTSHLFSFLPLCNFTVSPAAA